MFEPATHCAAQLAPPAAQQLHSRRARMAASDSSLACGLEAVELEWQVTRAGLDPRLVWALAYWAKTIAANKTLAANNQPQCLIQRLGPGK